MKKKDITMTTECGTAEGVADSEGEAIAVATEAVTAPTEKDSSAEEDQMVEDLVEDGTSTEMKNKV